MDLTQTRDQYVREIEEGLHAERGRYGRIAFDAQSVDLHIASHGLTASEVASIGGDTSDHADLTEEAPDDDDGIARRQ